MASDKGVPDGGFDERLAAIRDGILSPGESVLAQEEGDQGQAIALTDSRVIIIKAGITATGQSNGKIIGAFALGDIAAVNVRKGPLGAVIQVCVEGTKAPAPGEPPDNVIVFTGSQRMKKCEAIAARIEQVLGKPAGRSEAPAESPSQPMALEAAPSAEAAQSVEQPVPEVVEPAPTGAAQDVRDLIAAAEAAVSSAEPEPEKKPRRGGREARSLADEMFAEMTGQDRQPAENTQPVVEKAPEPVPVLQAAPAPEPAPAPVAEEPPVSQPVEETGPRYGPNPHLPKPATKHRASGRALVVLGGLAAALLVGVAVTAPLRAPQTPSAVQVDTSELTRNLPLLRKQSTAVADYEVRVVELLSESNQMIGRVEAALRSGNRIALAQELGSDPTGRAWRSLSSLQAPPGLAGARDNLTSGLFIRRNALATLSSELRAGGPIGAKEALSRLVESRSLITRGMASIDAMQADLERQMARHHTQGK